MKSKFILFLTGVLLFSTLGTSITYAESSNTEKMEIEKEMADFGVVNGDKTLDVLFAIENLPENIIAEGIEETAKWMEKETGMVVEIENDSLVFPELRQGVESENEIQPIAARGMLNCVTVVGLAVAGNGIPFTKILKLKQAIEFLGGVSKTIGFIQKKYKAYRADNYRMQPAFENAVKDTSKTLKADAQAAFLDFFGISAIIVACTDLDS